MSILEVRNIKKSFGKTEVLKGIDFSLERGEVLAIIGSSGSGKTTLLRCLNFLERADEGVISVNGKVIFNGEDAKTENEAVTRRKRLHFGLVFQSFNLFPQYTVLKNITMASELLIKGEARDCREEYEYNRKLRRLAFQKEKKETEKSRRAALTEAYLAAEAAEKQNYLARVEKLRVEQKEKLAQVEPLARELLAQVGLTEKADAYPCQLSGGQQQRVAIARAWALRPEILCFDEPTSALDPELTGEVLRVIRGLKGSDRTMIVVTHEMEFARNVADKVIFMADGVIEEMGTPEQIFDHPQSEKTRAFLHSSLELSGKLED